MTEDYLAKRLGVDAQAVDGFCRKWGVAELAVFGSALREDFDETSDVDLLVTFDGSARRSLWDLIDVQEELRLLFGRDVDLQDQVEPLVPPSADFEA